MYYTEGYIKDIRFESVGQSCVRDSGKRMIIIEPTEPYKITLGEREYALFVDSGNEWDISVATGNTDVRIAAQLRCANSEYVIGTVLGCDGVASLIALKQGRVKIRIYVEEGIMVLRLLVK